MSNASAVNGGTVVLDEGLSSNGHRWMSKSPEALDRAASTTTPPPPPSSYGPRRPSSRLSSTAGTPEADVYEFRSNGTASPRHGHAYKPSVDKGQQSVPYNEHQQQRADEPDYKIPVYPAARILRRASKTIDGVVKAPVSVKWLYLHFVLSVALPISNKSVLPYPRTYMNGLTRGGRSLLLRWFPFPFILATVQMACSTLGTVFAAQRGYFRQASMTTKRNRWMQFIALIFSLDILTITISIRWTSLPYHLSVRALSPVATLIIEILFGKAKSTLRTASFLLLIVIGIIFTSHHIPLSSPGAVVTIFAACLGTAKSLVTTHLLQNHFRLHPMDILSKTSPLAMGHTALFALFTGELGELWRIRGEDFTNAHLVAVLANGFLSFLFAVVGFKAEERNTTPSLSISTHAAQALTIVVSLFVYGLSLSPLNFIGIALTLAGGVLFALYDLQDLEEYQKAQIAMLPT